MKKILFLIIILLVSGFSSAQADWSNPNPATAININDGFDDQIEVVNSDQHIVYTDYGHDKFSLYLYTIATGEQKLLAEQTDDKFYPSIDDNDIVWMVAENGKKYINHYRINTKESSVYAMSGNYHDTHPYIQNDKISFIRWNLNNNSSYVVVYNIITGTLENVDATRDSKQTNQQHYNNTIVWQDARNDIDEIFIKDMIDGDEVVWNLSNNGLNHYFPKIDMRNVIWDTLNTVYAKNLDSQSLQIIGSNNYANFYSDISGNNIVYQSERNGRYDIYLYNLKTQSETKLTNSYHNDESPNISGNIVSWRRQNSNGRYDVHYMNIKPILEKIYSQLNFQPITSSEVKITWADHEDDNYTNANLYRSDSSTQLGSMVTSHLTGQTFNDTNLVPGKNYYYTLCWVDNNGIESPWCEQFRYEAKNQRLVKLNNSPAVYLIDHNDFYTIFNEDIFHAYGFQWQSINTITQRGLDEFHYNGALKYPSGTLIKTSDNSVYLIYDSVARPFNNEEVFIVGGYDWQNIKYISQTIFNTYQLGETITIENFQHPNNSLIKYTYSPNVYFIDNGHKRLIQDEPTFYEHGFNWHNVLTVPVYIEYPTGPNL